LEKYIRYIHRAVFQSWYLTFNTLNRLTKARLPLARFQNGVPVDRSVLLVASDGSRFWCSPEDVCVLSEVYHDRVYDRVFQPKEGMAIVDAGSHVGFYSIMAARRVGSRGTVYSFEPDPYNHALLTANLRMNKLTMRVTPFKIALSDCTGTARLYHDPRWHRGHTLIKAEMHKQSVPVKTERLDTIVDKEGIDHIDILKVDVEGAEPQVLKGAEDSINCIQNATVAAYHNIGPWQTKNEHEAVAKYLKRLGFKVWQTRHGRHVYVHASTNHNVF
jgi:FkbM family methyltransferase